jgi:hypothetical protein
MCLLQVTLLPCLREMNRSLRLWHSFLQSQTALLSRIHKVPRLNLDPKIAYPEGFHSFLQTLQLNVRIILQNKPRTAFFYIFAIDIHLIIRYYSLEYWWRSYVYMSAYGCLDKFRSHWVIVRKHKYTVFNVINTVYSSLLNTDLCFVCLTIKLPIIIFTQTFDFVPRYYIMARFQVHIVLTL